ncbi:MAG: biopolymer transporter ExbD [Sphingobacteriales bacterium]|jgi:biopolymer transport protein ExbD|nr:MAG: biopolymer transporter ExbD [Sphingobacteriales bacterium]
MKFRRQARREEHIDVTNFIDVLLLLLIFFMIATTMTKEGHLKLELPQAVGSDETAKVDRIEVIVDQKGSYTLNGQALINSQSATLMSAIEKLAIADKKTAFVVTADANVPYQAVVTVMEAAGKSGYSNIQLTTQLPGGPAPAP